MRQTTDRLWKLYVYAIPFHRVLALPSVLVRIQPPEIVFIPLLATACTNVKQLLRRSFWHFLDIVVVLWPALQLIPCIHDGVNRNNLTETAGALYLVALYFSIRLLTSRTLLDSFSRIFVSSATLAALLGIVGWSLLVLFDIETPLVRVYYYPYVAQDFVRARAFAATATMLSNILMVGIIFHTSTCLAKKSFRGRALVVLVILVGGFCLTFSKTVACLLAGLAVTYATARTEVLRKRKAKIALCCMVLACLLIYIVGTHVIFIGDDPNKVSALVEANYITPAALWTFTLGDTTYGAYPTNYLYNKRASLLAFTRSDMWGVGGGGDYNAFVGELQAQGEHPDNFGQYDPHSTYFGALAELGIVGLLGVLLIWGTVGVIIFSRLGRDRKLCALNCALAGAFVAIIIQAVSTDVMNFRQHWCVIAVARGLVGPVTRDQSAPVDGVS